MASLMPRAASFGIAATALVVAGLVFACGCNGRDLRRTLGLLGDPHPDVVYSVATDERTVALASQMAPWREEGR